jgi:Tfp pilus assembly protein FimT
MPKVGAMSDGRAGMAAAMLQRDLLFARERAVNTGVVHWVEFSVGTGSYTLSAEQPPSFGFASRLALRDPARNATYQRFLNRDELAGVTLTSVNLTSNPIGFNRLGRPITTAGALITGDGVVTLTGGRTVTVTGSTGLAVRSTSP